MSKTAATDWLDFILSDEGQLAFDHMFDLARKLDKVPREVVRTYDPSGDGPIGLAVHRRDVKLAEAVLLITPSNPA